MDVLGMGMKGQMAGCGGAGVALVGENTLAWLSPTAGKKGGEMQGEAIWKEDRAFVWDLLKQMHSEYMVCVPVLEGLWNKCEEDKANQIYIWYGRGPRWKE